MASASTNRIAIIGAGFSGSLLAVQLLRRFLPDARLYLIEQNAQFGRGLAYSTGNPNHLLNVRAGRMSAFADDPDHFVRWLERTADAAGLPEDFAAGPESFVPRRLYGAYIQELLGNEFWKSGNAKHLFLVPDEAVAIRPRREELLVEVRGGRRYTVDCAVLATGNVPNDDAAAHYFGNPWNPAALAGLDPDAPVLLTGTGLTMVDTVVSLIDQGYRGTIHAVSRRGLLPRRHGEAPPSPVIEPDARQTPSLVRLLREVRAAVRAEPDNASAWRSVVDGLRPHTRALWQALSDAEKRRFLRHLRPWWEVHRHRMAPEVAGTVAELMARRQLVVWAARIERTERHQRGLTVTLRRRGTEDRERLTVARHIDCSGPQFDYARVDNALIQDLLQQGAVRPDQLRLGLDVTAESALVDRWGVASQRLYALGPVTRGTFWEITSVPDIREQCWQLARLLERRMTPAGFVGAAPDFGAAIDPLFRL
jgi:uncharacterized NAD(P)/FAD-binding protein YdhS